MEIKVFKNRYKMVFFKKKIKPYEYTIYLRDEDPDNYLWITYEGPDNVKKHKEITNKNFWIEINLGDGYTGRPRFETYRLSLTEPKYYNLLSWITPGLLEPIIDLINRTYKDAIKIINEEAGREIVNPNNPIPDYSIVETEEDEILDQYLDFYFNHLTITNFDKYFFDNECDYYMIYPCNCVSIYYMANGFYYYHEVRDEEFYIKVIIHNPDTHKCRTYRISLNEPKYIYKSDKLPEEYRDTIIKGIFDSYEKGLISFREYHDNSPDPNRPIPDYWKL